VVLEFVLGVVGAGVTGGAVLLALEQRRFLALAVAVATVCNGILLGECALEGAVDLGVHDFDGLHGYVCSQAAATLGTDLGVGVDAGLVRPLGYGDVTEHGTGHVGGNGVGNAAVGTGVVYGQGGLFIPAEQLVNHGVAFLAAPEHGKG